MSRAHLAGASARVLVADDEPTLRRLLKTVLQTGGFQVTEATSGQEAIPMLRGGTASGRPDVLIIDLALADSEGLDLLRQVRQREALDELPVIFITNDGSRQHRSKVLQLGADALLTKPFSALHLQRVVRVLADSGRHAQTPDPEFLTPPAQ